MSSIRQSNFELLRIIAMFMVLLLHANYYTFGEVGLDDYARDPLNSILRMLAEQSCIVAVNVFVLISGYFGIRPSFKGIMSLLFQIFFWGGFTLLMAFLLGMEIPVKESLKVMFAGGGYWFVPAYLCLYCLAPVLNAFSESVTKREWVIVLCGFFTLQFSFGWLTSMGTYSCGYSAISFIGLYLLARFLKVFSPSISNHHRCLDIVVYCIATIIPVALCIFGKSRIGWDFAPNHYTSPFVILSSVALLVYFSKIHFTSKTVNWIAASVFSVYLFHQHPIIAPWYCRFVQYLCDSNSPVIFIILLIVSCLVILFACVIIDKLRIILWRFLYAKVINPGVKKLCGCFNILINE